MRVKVSVLVTAINQTATKFTKIFPPAVGAEMAKKAISNVSSCPMSAIRDRALHT